MRKLLCVAMACGLASGASVASADIIGGDVSAAYWAQNVVGDFALGSDSVDLENDLNMDGDKGYAIAASFEHFVPLLPNARIAYTAVEQSGEGSVGSYDGVSGTVKSTMDVEMVDLTAYYEILDNIVDLDLGLTIRTLSADLSVSGGGNTSESNVKGALPMVYAAAGVNLPFTGVSAGAEANVVSYGGDTIVDGAAYVQYSLMLMELRGGYRILDIDYEDDNATLKMKNYGPFFSVGVDF